jgi:hypothetical protein
MLLVKNHISELHNTNSHAKMLMVRIVRLKKSHLTLLVAEIWSWQKHEGIFDGVHSSLAWSDALLNHD